MPIERMVGGINPAWRFGNKFVKRVEHGGSPHAEHAVSKGFQLLGVPHNPTVATSLKKPLVVPSAFEDKQDQILPEHHLVVSNFRSLHPIADIGNRGLRAEDHLGALMNHRQHINTLLAEWLHSVSDRHAGNYALTPEQGIISIDHGEAFHPATSMFHQKNPDQWFSLHKNPEAWSVAPNRSSLNSLMIHHPFSSSREGAQGDNQLVQKILANREALIRLAHEGTQGLSEPERDLAVQAMKNRLHVLSEHANSRITYEMLNHLHQRAYDLAKRSQS